MARISSMRASSIGVAPELSIPATTSAAPASSRASGGRLDAAPSKESPANSLSAAWTMVWR